MIAFSPIRQDPEVLSLFLEAMAWQNIELWAYDDNIDSEASKLLADTRVLPPIDLPDGEYRRASTHVWSPGSMRRVAAIKNHAIETFLETDYEHLFLIDSDVLIPSGAVDHLREADEQVIAATYWTRWRASTPAEIRALEHEKSGYERRLDHAAATGDTAQADLLRARIDAVDRSFRGDGPNMFWLDPQTNAQLRKPGHWRVGGLGACTLIRRDVFDTARFDETKHLVNEGEDRWFCWRCNQADIPLIACTHLDVFHLYRDTQLDDARRWVEDHRTAQLV